ncbi:tRNA uridine-5-carboxymethylaminomethyl(34) synthesis GTPase MnmE [Rhodovibrio salinarum]|uniref:tRNA modification GTPase MnmE n=1 Tax=Rhodovibrio salinarum TaxID=1087 RepID=A0A934QHI0_9PROT|nr:tRNA uridine-5-carboxymethylaminomethyl(34) synthesis GTPase MnmE [Rhodovibrio salinarum]MBK1696888.1 tRNA uridine-5-carboxymethylaminomethyl(34) synthesis GTPase MnmE [Rhodovibrio salinarum]
MTARTIFALSTAPGRAGVAVIRISGPDAAAVLKALAGDLPAPRHAVLRTLTDTEKEPIDRSLVLWFPGPKSFTGEDLAELHVHGGRAIIQMLTDVLAAQQGLRPAEAGEFTRRAFDAGKLDLTEVEGLADLIDAETRAQARQALRQMEGALGQRITDWRDRLLRARAHMEAAIDFADEELPEGLDAEVRVQIMQLAGEIDATLQDAARGERLREGLTVAIVGAPNAGKSSLLNAVAARDAAIVAETAGTTRDIVEVHLDLGGYPVTLADTAGLRALDPADADPIEAEGIRRARAKAEQADLRLVVFDATQGIDAATADLLNDDSLIAWNKQDLPGGTPPVEVASRPVYPVSARTHAGLPELLDRLQAKVTEQLGVAGAAPAITRARHRSALQAASEALDRAGSADAAELAAEDLRYATHALGRVTGEVDVEDLLDVIFRDFCIGK